jgi:glycosyltransferase involved in cell wall biosynthesis
MASARGTLRVSYVTMQFPAISETFAASDIAALRGLGVEVAVHAYRGHPADCDRLLNERGLQGLALTHGGPAELLRGVFLALRRPWLLVELLSWCVGCAWNHPRHLFSSLLLVPRTIAIFAEIERRRPDVVHLFWGHYPAMLGYLVKRRPPGCVVSQFLGAYDLCRAYPGSRKLARQADVVWTHALANRPALAALGIPAERIGVAYRGVNLQAVDSCRPQSGEKIPGRIVTAGRLLPGKKFDAVLRVFSLISKHRPEATLTIMGDGPDAARLQHLAGELGIGERVRFAGHVSQAEVFREMWQAEWLLFLSQKDSERLPNVVKEAMACGCIPIVAGTPGIDELVQHGRSGFVVSSEDAAAVAEIIRNCESFPAMKAELIAQGRCTLEEAFDVTKTMAVYLDRWRVLTEGRG